MSMPSKYINQTYHYKGVRDVPCFCGLKIIHNIEKATDKATELHDSNTGTSVTKCVDKPANELIHKFKIDPEKLVFIEHLPDRNSNLAFFQETFELVSFDWSVDKFINPSRTKICMKRSITSHQSSCDNLLFSLNAIPALL